MARNRLAYRGAAPRMPGSPRRPHLAAIIVPPNPERFFVTLPENEVHSTDAGSTHAVDILAFVEAQEIPSLYFETPYYLAPAPGGETMYALLRETLRSTRKIGIACVVIQARQHLAVLVPQGQSLVLNTLRWGCDDRQPDELADDVGDDLPILDGFPNNAPGAYPLGLGSVASRGGEMRSGLSALTELDMKTKKSTEIIIQEVDNMLDDEDLLTDDYLEMALRRSPHQPRRWASRAAAPAFRAARPGRPGRIRR